MEVSVTATVNYTCYLKDSAAKRVREYAKNNDCNLEEAVWALYVGDMLDLYADSVESDFSTKSIDAVN